MTPTERIASNIAKRRKVLGITQKQLADMLGTYSTAISLWERAHHAPNLDRLDDVAKALECTAQDLLK